MEVHYFLELYMNILSLTTAKVLNIITFIVKVNFGFPKFW